MAAQSTDSRSTHDIAVDALFAQLTTLNTLAQVAQWDKQAESVLADLNNAIAENTEQIAHLTKAIEQERKFWQAKSFVSRMFTSRKTEYELQRQLQCAHEQQPKLAELAFRVQERIDFTPNSVEDQKALLSELRERKKELQLTKRELNAHMKTIRTKARQESAVVGTHYSSQGAAWRRRQIRYDKEAELRPHEDEKSATERRLLQTERDILWVQKFKES